MWHRHEKAIILACLTILLRIPSLFEPYWYGDEGIYLIVGQALRHGLELYKQIHDNKPPFIYLIAALADGRLFWFKFLALVFNVATIIIFYHLAKKWFAKERLAFLSTLFFIVFTTIPLFEGNIANAELFFILFTVSSFAINFSHRKDWQLVISGLILGLGGLFKIPALVEVVVWPLFWFITQTKGWFKKSLFFGGATLVPLALSIVYFWSRGSLNNYLIAAGLRNIPYLSSWQANVPIIGSLIGRASLLAVVLICLFLLRKHISKPVLLICIWFSTALFAALLSGRPYPHYLMQLSPVLVLAIFEIKKSPKLVTGILVSLVVVWQVFGFYHYSIGNYYNNFLSWAMGQKTTNQYRTWFGSTVNQDYEVAGAIDAGSRPTDKIFVWGDEMAIYALSRRLPDGIYAARYHIEDFRAQTQTINTLVQNPPRFIVIFNHQTDLPGLGQLLDRHYIFEEEINSAQVFRYFPSQAL